MDSPFFFRIIGAGFSSRVRRGNIIPRIYMIELEMCSTPGTYFKFTKLFN